MAIPSVNYLEKASSVFQNYISTFLSDSTSSSNYWREGCSADSFLDFLLLAWEHDHPADGSTPDTTYFPDSSDLDTFFTAFHNGYITGTLDNSTIQYDDYSWYALASAKAFDPAYQPVFQTAERIKIFQNIALNLWGVLYEGDFETMAKSSVTGLNDAWENASTNFPYISVNISQNHLIARGLFHKGTANTFNGYYDPKLDPHPSPKGKENNTPWPTSNAYYVSKDQNGNPTDTWAVPRFMGGSWQYDALTPDQITWATTYYEENFPNEKIGDFLNVPMTSWMDTSQIGLMIGLYMRMSSQMQKAFLAQQQTPPSSTITKRAAAGHIYIDDDTYAYLSKSAGNAIVTVNCNSEAAANELATKLKALSSSENVPGLDVNESGSQIEIAGKVVANKSTLENSFAENEDSINHVVWDTVFKTEADAIYNFAMVEWLGVNDDKDQTIYPVPELKDYLKDTDQYHLFNLFGKTVSEIKGDDHPPMLVRERVPTYKSTKDDGTSYAPSPAFTPNRYWAGDQGNLIGGLIEYSGISFTNKSEAVGFAISLMKGVAENMTIPDETENGDKSRGILSTLPSNGQLIYSNQDWWAANWCSDQDISPLYEYLKNVKHVPNAGTVFGDATDYAAGAGIYLRGVIRGCRLNSDFKKAANDALNASPATSIIVANTNLPEPGSVFQLSPPLFRYQNKSNTFLVAYLLTS
ncbi:MAG: hypothetical protein AAGA77_17800 [Bacteroidota bacterium]